MEPVLKQQYFTVEEYEAYEAGINGRAEYRDGIIVDMAGGSKSHGQIAANFIGELYSRLKGRPCIVYTADVKVQAEAARSYLYPDLSVACDETEVSRLQNQTLKQPLLIVEVLSEATALDDIGAKFFAYQQIQSLQDYVLVDQFSPVVYVNHRNVTGDWEGKIYVGLEMEVDLRSLGLKIPMADIYDKVAFPENKRPLIQG